MMADGGQSGGLGDALVKLWPVIAGVAVAGWTSLRAALKGRELNDRARGEVITIAQKAATDMIRLLEERGVHLQKRVDDLEDEVQTLQRGLTSKDAELALLRGQVRQWQSVALSYEAKLTEAGIAHERPRQAFWGLEAGDAPADLVEGKLP
jgi:uncharacterized protein HemX